MSSTYKECHFNANWLAFKLSGEVLRVVKAPVSRPSVSSPGKPTNSASTSTFHSHGFTTLQLSNQLPQHLQRQITATPTRLTLSSIQIHTRTETFLSSNPGRITQMALFSSNKRNNNSSNYGSQSNHKSMTPVLAHCFATSGYSAAVNSFSYCSTGANGMFLVPQTLSQAKRADFFNRGTVAFLRPLQDTLKVPLQDAEYRASTTRFRPVARARSP
jgi:hypothetical protein